MLAPIKKAIKPFVPRPVLAWYWRRSNRRRTNAERFGQIYREKLWGGVRENDFFSGYGTVPAVVEPYVSSVRMLLSQRAPVDVVEIGCGDFTVASSLTDLARTYTACDVVPELIERNRRRFVRDNLRFVAIDAVTDPLPPGELVIVRQVLQHLRNDQIQSILQKLTQYPTWIISEHVPSREFVPNRDILSGPDTRLSVGSGVVITEEPFSVRPRHADVLSEVHVKDGLIRTHAYSF